MNKRIDEEYYEVVSGDSIAERLLVKARSRMHKDFLRMTTPSPQTTILDVGVSDVQVKGANWLETAYDHPEKIHACGLGEGNDFRKAFPSVAYTQIIANERLPFDDQYFDIATANAVLEHVGSVDSQRGFIEELLRVSKQFFITVPHRYFPIEHHTSIPFAHYFDLTFDVICRVLGKERWTDQRNLILMTVSHLKSISPANSIIGYTGLPLGPFSSNIFLYCKNKDSS